MLIRGNPGSQERFTEGAGPTSTLCEFSNNSNDDPETSLPLNEISDGLQGCPSGEGSMLV